ncbi:hypothetical protein HNR46_000938 [Haloferula luteola]|uniref:Uncharacterized protein n=1 Tax=Haloferula luteola TaxID=595692 RepID=A0A840V9T2_9BACT|nr:hypothetical protein [Haloferula luteola]
MVERVIEGLDRIASFLVLGLPNRVGLGISFELRYPDV